MHDNLKNAAAGRPGCLAHAAGDAQRLECDIPSLCVQAHAANLMPLPNGDLACVWFGGSQEGVADISIYFSRLAKGSVCWSTPVKLSDDPTRSEQNPILFPAPDGRLWLLYTAQKSGNQDTAIVRCRVSDDNGETWGAITTLFDKAGTFVRQPVVVLDNGEWLVPVFYCRTRPGEKWVGNDDVSAVRISVDQGKTWSEYEVPGSVGCVHMNVEQLRDGSLIAFFRSRWADNIYVSRSTDRGRTWSAPVATDLPNNNSSIQFTQLANGHLAMVFNDISAAQATERRVSLYDEIEDEEAGAEESGAAAAVAVEPAPSASGRTAFWGTPRAPMTLAISEDGGRTWPYKRNLEVGDGYCMTNNSQLQLNREFSYPSIKQTSDGLLNIAYTFYRQRIKYVRVAEDWVRG
jgi:predicted neuraminidase